MKLFVSNDVLSHTKLDSNILVENDFFLKNYVTSEGAVSHNVLHYQQLPITRYQVSFFKAQLFWVITYSVQCL